MTSLAATIHEDTMLDAIPEYERGFPEENDNRLTIAAIIPLYNGAAYIETALLSVLFQTRPPDEIIVVDDGSTDHGPAVVERLARSYPIRLLHKANGGQSAARNFAVRNTTAALIALLDQDDVWYPDHLERLMKPFLVTGFPELGWSYSDLDEIDENGALVRRNFLASLGTPHPKTDVFNCLNQDMFVLPSASLVSRKAFESVGGFDERLCGYEDDDLFLRLFRANYRNVFIPDPLSKWRIHVGSTSYTPRMARSRAIYARKLLTTFPDDPVRSRYYTRHLIVPRFLPRMYEGVREALRRSDPAPVAEAMADMALLMPGSGRRVQLKFRLLQLALRSRHGRLFARMVLR
ncbi:MAG: glycosyltransferase [Janthinobacterium lividum]